MKCFFSRLFIAGFALLHIFSTGVMAKQPKSPVFQKEKETLVETPQVQSTEQPSADTPATEQPNDQAPENIKFKKVQSLNWQYPPKTSLLGDEALIVLSEGVGFIGPKDTNEFMKLTDNLPCGNCYTLASGDLSWFALFNFNDSGYVRDNEILDADAILKTLQKNNYAANEERSRRGLPKLMIDGWFVPPHYDTSTNRLEWATKAHSDDGSTVVNYSTRLLGRGGVMNATLVSSPETLENDLASFKRALNGFSFRSGKTYAEYHEGDKVAEYGLAALIVGGAAAAAVKSGAGKGLIAILAGLASAGAKFVWIFVLAVVMGVWNMIKRLFSRK